MACRRSLVALVTAVVVLVCLPAGPSFGAPTPPAGNCPDVLFLGARGSGEVPQPPIGAANDPTGHHGLGVTLWDAYQGLRLGAPKLRVDGEGIDYLAAPVFPGIGGQPGLLSSPGYYAQSVALGAQEFLRVMTERIAECGAVTDYVLGGYSQGAWALHIALDEMTVEQRTHIAAVLMFGDPRLDNSSTAVRMSKAKGGNGVAYLYPPIDPSYLPPGMADVAASYCNRKDPICQPHGSDPATVTSCLAGACPHFTYVADGITDKGSRYALRLVRPLTRQVAVATVKLPDAQVGVRYAASLSAQRGKAPYQWSVLSPLPGWLSVSAAGVLTGTPTAAGNETLQVQVADARGTSGTASLGIIVRPATLAVSTQSLPDATTGAPYDVPLAASGGVPPYAWTATGLPPGLSVSATGLISGVPDVAGTSSVTVTLTDSSGAVRSATLLLNVVDPAMPEELTIDTTSLPDAVTGLPYSASISGHGGTAPLTWSTAGAFTYPGLAFDPSVPAIAGTPTHYGDAFVAVNLTDASGVEVQQQYYLRVLTSPTPATVLPAMTLNQPYTATLPSPAGITPVSWAIANGPGEFLPRGLTLDSATGVISGTPFVFFNEVAIDTPFVLAVTDTNGIVHNVDYTLPINGCRTAFC